MLVFGGGLREAGLSRFIGGVIGVSVLTVNLETA